ncbi:MAG: AAA family ATPase [Acidobacteria bacterium]|nr:AAA family ATPase [Acidobacteriota bacterium]
MSAEDEFEFDNSDDTVTPESAAADLDLWRAEMVAADLEREKAEFLGGEGEVRQSGDAFGVEDAEAEVSLPADFDSWNADQRESWAFDPYLHRHELKERKRLFFAWESTKTAKGPAVVTNLVPRFRVLDRDDLDNLPVAVEMIGGVLPAQGALTVIAGSFGFGKSLITLDWSGTISTPALTSWYSPDHPVNSHGLVLYIAREGFYGIPKRVRAWEIEHGHRLDDVKWMPDPIDLKKPADAADLKFIAGDLGAVLIVTDSVRATGAGAEDTADMGAYVKGLETLTGAGFAVISPHNTGWDTSRPRGSTVLPDAADTLFILEGGRNPGDIRMLRHQKHRDGEPITKGLSFGFKEIPGTESGVLVPATATALTSSTPASNSAAMRLAKNVARIDAMKKKPLNYRDVKDALKCRDDTARTAWNEWKRLNP